MLSFKPTFSLSTLSHVKSLECVKQIPKYALADTIHINSPGSTLLACYLVTFFLLNFRQLILFYPKTLVFASHLLRPNFWCTWFNFSYKLVVPKRVPLFYTLHYVSGYVILKLFTLPQLHVHYLGLW